MVEYQTICLGLSKFAGDYISDEQEKCRLFQEGLNVGIRARTKLYHFTDFLKLVQGALDAEEIEKDFSTRRQERSKRSGFSFSSSKT